MEKKIIIAIDGYSSCGKSTIAKALAKEFKYSFIDTGAMYRAATLHMLNAGVKAENKNDVINELKNLNISFKFNSDTQKSDTYLNGKNVEKEIREMNVSNNVSHFSSIKELRQAMVKQQQLMGLEKGVVLDGRDIGTIVFPQAELKIFMTAAPEVRAQRRFDELSKKGDKVTLEEVASNLKERDLIDSTRKESPLLQAKDAKVLDNSNLNMQEQLDIAIKWTKEAML